MKKVFVDSSALFAAVCSPTGGSAKLFTVKNIQLVVSRLVLTEVESNVRKKLQTFHLERFFLLVDKMTILSQSPDASLVKKAKKVIVEKDAIILAEAKQAKANYLVTLDKKHFLQQKAVYFAKPKKILTPGEFVKKQTI